MPQRFPPPSCPTPAEWPLAPSCRPAVPPRHWQPRARRANSVKQRMRHQPIESRLSCLGPNCIAISALPSSPNIGFGSKPRVTPPSARGQGVKGRPARKFRAETSPPGRASGFRAGEWPQMAKNRIGSLKNCVPKSPKNKKSISLPTTVRRMVRTSLTDHRLGRRYTGGCRGGRRRAVLEGIRQPPAEPRRPPDGFRGFQPRRLSARLSHSLKRSSEIETADLARFSRAGIGGRPCQIGPPLI